MNKESVYFST